MQEQHTDYMFKLATKQVTASNHKLLLALLLQSQASLASLNLLFQLLTPSKYHGVQHTTTAVHQFTSTKSTWI